jgi:hypothetical protein
VEVEIAIVNRALAVFRQPILAPVLQNLLSETSYEDLCVLIVLRHSKIVFKMGSSIVDEGSVRNEDGYRGVHLDMAHSILLKGLDCV